MFWWIFLMRPACFLDKPVVGLGGGEENYDVSEFLPVSELGRMRRRQPRAY